MFPSSHSSAPARTLSPHCVAQRLGQTTGICEEKLEEELEIGKELLEEEEELTELADEDDCCEELLEEAGSEELEDDTVGHHCVTKRLFVLLFDTGSVWYAVPMLAEIETVSPQARSELIVKRMVKFFVLFAANQLSRYVQMSA